MKCLNRVSNNEAPFKNLKFTKPSLGHYNQRYATCGAPLGMECDKCEEKFLNFDGFFEGKGDLEGAKLLMNVVKNRILSYVRKFCNFGIQESCLLILLLRTPSSNGHTCFSERI